MDFVGRDALIAGMHEWVLDKASPLSAILERQGVLNTKTRSLLDALVEEHIKLHGADAQEKLGRP